MIGLFTYLSTCTLPHFLTASRCLFKSCETFIKSQNFQAFLNLDNPSNAFASGSKPTSALRRCARETIKTLIFTKTC